jgi:hypothetical protein
MSRVSDTLRGNRGTASARFTCHLIDSPAVLALSGIHFVVQMVSIDPFEDTYVVFPAPISRLWVDAQGTLWMAE